MSSLSSSHAMKISFVSFIPKAVVLLAIVGSEWSLGQARGELGPGARAAGQERSRAELAAQDLVSLSAETVIGLLRREPGLLLQVKRVLVRAAYEQGRLLDPEDLSDEALFRLVREDQTIRVLVTQEIERRSYIHAKPTREERTRGLAADTRELGTEGGAARERETTLDPRQQLERTDKRPPVDEFTDPLPVDAAPMPKVRPEELPGLLLASGGSKLSGGNTDPESISGSGPDPAPDSTGPDSPPRQAGQPPGVDAGKGSSAGRIGPQTEGSVTMDLAPDRAGLHHRANPYADIPSLYDFYQQYSGRPAQVERFGADVFRNGTGNFNDLPMDLPVGPEYVLGPGDGLSISLWGGVSRRLQSVVDRQGRVALPEVGAVEVSGKSLGDVQLLVQSALRTQFRDVQADISLARLRAVRIYVVGDVQRPGAYDVSSLSTPLNALYQAGGPTARGSLRVVRHYRGRRLVQEIDVYDLLLHGIRSGLLGLQAGDTILVPPLGSEIAIEGMVRRPARYELNGETSLAQALELAGGVLRSGTLRHIDVERVDAHISRDMLRLDIPEDNDPGTVTKVLEEFRVQDGDKIKISPILPYAEKTVYLEGHVFRPGKYAFREGMVITDLIKSYND